MSQIKTDFSKTYITGMESLAILSVDTLIKNKHILDTVSLLKFDFIVNVKLRILYKYTWWVMLTSHKYTMVFMKSIHRYPRQRVPRHIFQTSIVKDKSTQKIGRIRRDLFGYRINNVINTGIYSTPEGEKVGLIKLVESI